MNRIFSLVAPLIGAATLATVPLAAQAQTGGYYVATPAAVATKPTVITSGIVWKWNAPNYVAAQSTQRDAITCQMIARDAGKLSSFSADGKAFDAAAMEKCNARAK